MHRGRSPGRAQRSPRRRLWPRRPDWGAAYCQPGASCHGQEVYLFAQPQFSCACDFSSRCLCEQRAFTGSVCRNVGTFGFLDRQRFTWSTFSWWGQREGDSCCPLTGSPSAQGTRPPHSGFTASCEHLLRKHMSDCTVSCFRCCQNPSSSTARTPHAVFQKCHNLPFHPCFWVLA